MASNIETIDQLPPLTPTIDDVIVGMDQTSPWYAKQTTLQTIYNLFKTLYDAVYMDSTTTSNITGAKTFTQVLKVLIGGTPTTLTNPNIQATNSQDNFTQIANQNKSSGVNASADIIAYPDNNTNDTTGFIDIGIASSAFNQAAYAITTPNDAYVFGSAVSGAGKLWNLVIATDSTGSSNNIIMGIGGFNSLNKERFRLTNTLASFGFQSIASGVLKLWNSGNAFATTIQQPTIAADATITLPNATSTLATTNLAETITAVKTFSAAPVLNALPTGSAVTSASTASTLMTRDANGNANVSILWQWFTTTATAAGTTTLTIAAKYTNVFTGTTTQTVLLPTTSVAQGQQYFIVNTSTGNVTVQSSGANTVQILGAGMNAIFTALVATPTTAANWSCALEDSTGVNLATTATANAATINLAYKTNTITNNSAATLTITLPTAGAIDWEMRIVRVLDFSAVAQTITWVNTENGEWTAPILSNWSTTLPRTIWFMYNNATSKWRCLTN